MKYLSLLVISFLMACGGGANPDKEQARKSQNFSGLPIDITSGDVSLSPDGVIQGTGSVLFLESLGEVKSGKSFRLEFTLEPGGSLSFLSYASKDLGQGYEILFRRVETRSLGVQLIAEGQTKGTLDRFASTYSDVPISIQVDVHNNETPAHVIMWDALATNSFTSLNALVNTEDDFESEGSPGNGYGNHFGLKLNKARVTKILVEASKLGH